MCPLACSVLYVATLHSMISGWTCLDKWGITCINSVLLMLLHYPSSSHPLYLEFPSVCLQVHSSSESLWRGRETGWRLFSRCGTVLPIRWVVITLTSSTLAVYRWTKTQQYILSLLACIFVHISLFCLSLTPTLIQMVCMPPRLPFCIAWRWRMWKLAQMYPRMPPGNSRNTSHYILHLCMAVLYTHAIVNELYNIIELTCEAVFVSHAHAAILLWRAPRNALMNCRNSSTLR